MKLTGRKGTLRIYDSSLNIHGQAPLAGLTMDVVKYDGAAWSNITSDVEADDANTESAFIADNNDVIYIGSTSRFAMVRYLKGNGTNYAAGSGALIRKYYNGSDFNSSLAGASDGTASGGDCFAQDGNISFKIPRDWAIGANSFDANLDSDKYYIALSATTSPTTDPDADVLAPVDGQYFTMRFAAMDFDGPEGRALTDEILVLDRGTMNSLAHYIEGPDDPLFEILETMFSCALDDTYNKGYIFEALTCGNPNYSTWTSAGTSSKGDTQNDGSNDNPAFADSGKKAVNVQILWEGDNPIGNAYYEVFFPEDFQRIAESETGINLSCRGGIYGVIEDIFGFGVRY